MATSKQERITLTAAKNQGHLDPILDYLARKIAERSKPMPVEGPEWPLKRAEADGGLKDLRNTLTWILDRTNFTPDGAENTEE